MSHSGSVKKSCPEANGNDVKQSQTQTNVNTLRKPEATRHAAARDVLQKVNDKEEAKPASKISLNEVKGMKPAVQVVKKEQEKKLPRQ